ncbi:hypothetical protein [Comamonas aquatica]|uniref:hypothetical protein n=1 Tax=Comamonas aquatica TaxID=225991 RepID=UPI003918DADF
MSEASDSTDWKTIAMQLARRVNFAVTNLKSNGGGMLDLNTGKITGWREYMAEGLEMIPGIVVDREILATLELPPSKRKKAQAAIREARKASQ